MSTIPSTSATHPLDYPAADGRTVTEGHARLCRERGHAAFVRDGVDQGTCPRCGEVTEAQPDALQVQLTATSNKGLLTTFAALTHQMTGSDSTDLRTQRDAVEAELLRRMAITDTAYAAGVTAGADQVARIAAAAVCGVPA